MNEIGFDKQSKKELRLCNEIKISLIKYNSILVVLMNQKYSHKYLE